MTRSPGRGRTRRAGRRAGVVDVQARLLSEEARQAAVMSAEPFEQAGVEPDLAVALEQQDGEVAAHAADLATALLCRLEVAELLVEHAAEHDPGDAHRPRSGERLCRCTRPADHDPPGRADVDGARAQLVARLVHRERAARRARRCPLPPTPTRSAPATRISIASASTLTTSPRTWPRTGSLPLRGATMAEPSSRSYPRKRQASLTRTCRPAPSSASSSARLEPCARASHEHASAAAGGAPQGQRQPAR